IFAGQPKRDRSAERVPDHPRRHEPQVLDQRSEVSDILTNAARSGGALALAVSAAVICKNPKRIGQARNNQVPVVVGIPGSMHQDQRNVPDAFEFVEELDAIHLCPCHFRIPTLKPAGSVASVLAQSPAQQKYTDEPFAILISAKAAGKMRD